MGKKNVTLLVGAGSGIGLEMAKRLVGQPGILVLVCKTAESARQTEINFRNVTAEVYVLACDISHQAQVHGLADELKQKFDAIDLCIFNAACIMSKFELTLDDIEMQLAVNHMASFILSQLLMPLFEASPSATVVFMNSRIHRIGDPEANMLRNSHASYIPTKAYADSKLLNIMYSVHLSHLLTDTRVRVITVMPGLVNTRIGNKYLSGFNALVWNAMKLFGTSPRRAAQQVLQTIDKASGDRYSNVWQNEMPAIVNDKVTNPKLVTAMLEVSYSLCKLPAKWITFSDK